MYATNSSSFGFLWCKSPTKTNCRIRNHIIYKYIVHSVYITTTKNTTNTIYVYVIYFVFKLKIKKKNRSHDGHKREQK